MTQSTIANDVSLFHSSLSAIGDTGNATSANNETTEFDESVVLMQLEKLKIWQKMQHEKLINQQLSQREVLRREKQMWYELFGLNMSNEINDSQKGDEGNGENDAYSSSEPITVEERPIQTNNSLESNRKINDKPEQIILKSPPIKLSLDKIVENMSVRPMNAHETSSTNENVVKRPFLKRGEGLKNRFKIEPDALRLNNLPKYKFARRAHALPNKGKRNRRHTESVRYDKIPATNALPPITSASTTTTVTVEKSSGEGHQNNVNQQNRILHVNKTSSTSNHIQSSSSIESSKKINNFGRKNGLKLKSIRKSVDCSGEKKSVENCRNDESHLSCENAAVKLTKSNNVHDVDVIKSTGIHFHTPSTKSLLDTPIRRRVSEQQHELALFEHLEAQMVSRNELRNLEMAESTDDNLRLQFEFGLNLGQKQQLHRNNQPNSSCEQSILSETSGIGADTESSRHVHFAIETNARESIPSTSNNVCSQPIYQNTSSPFEKSTDSFRKFKEKLFDKKLNQKYQTRLSLAKNFEISDWHSDDNVSELSAIDAPSTSTGITDEIRQRSVLMQERLHELETEINSFREQNNELTKLIQEHEMIRLTFDEERQTAQEQLEDERVQFEMYMHEEKMKLLNERSDLERRAKDLQRPQRSERDELHKLREKCVEHEKELTTRDQKHVAAQARIRAQLRNVEKELKELKFEVDNLRCENKKLETENVRLRRQGNNKLLQEINKNIAKLAPLNGQPPPEAQLVETGKTRTHGSKHCSNKSAHKTVVAKVTSQTDGYRGMRTRSKSVPNLKEMERTVYSPDMSPTTSDAENGLSEDEGKLAKETKGYFGVDTTNRQLNKSNQSVDAETNASTSFKRIIENPDGSKDIWYPNGNLKKISADAMLVRMLYFNKDIKETDIKEGTVKYYYAETNTWHTTYADGLEIIEFPNGQIEHRHKGGKVEVYFPNGASRITDPAREKEDGVNEEWKYPDGTNVLLKPNGERVLLLPNGQREIHTNGQKRREYPDGTVKIVYPDGSQESRYSNGRVRLKDKDGKLVMDSETIFV